MLEDAAITVMERCELLGSISEESGRLTRPYGSRSLREAGDRVAGWMRATGMSTRRDAAGNLIGRYEGAGDRTLVLGSHLDTVRDAGKYDGQLGVLAALACVQRLHECGERLPFAIEVVAFADEEGLRFGTTYLGSSVYAGAFNPELLDYRDAEGVSISEAVRRFGGDPDALAGDGRPGGDLIGYLELHIEQGPVLERLGAPVGIVSGITGLSRIGVGFTGKAGHAGTVPMQDRRDALCAAAEFVLEAESAAKSEPGAVATVGEISALPGAGNVIPGEARLSLDLRHQDDATRERLRERLKRRAREIADLRGCAGSWQVRQESGAVPCDPELSGLLERAVQSAGISAHRLPSGAGHDAAQVAELAPVAMLFVRCKEGISHNPAESVSKEDVAAALDVLERFLQLLAEGEGPHRGGSRTMC
jgi:allantoate deiminase